MGADEAAKALRFSIRLINTLRAALDPSSGGDDDGWESHRVRRTLTELAELYERQSGEITAQSEETPRRAIYMTLISSIGAASAVFVKELNFFCAQGGLDEEWGRNWVPVVARNIEEAREMREAMAKTGEDRVVLLEAILKGRDQSDEKLVAERDELRTKLRAFEEAIEVEEGRVVATDWRKLQAIFDAAGTPPARKS